MRIAFVGVKRKYQELPPGYRDHFNRFHLELPWYFSRDGKNDVTITTVDHSDTGQSVGEGQLRCRTEDEFVSLKPPVDVVVHWRKWFPELYRPEAVNLINCQDHSFSPEWKSSVTDAISSGRCRGILCFPTWHKQNLKNETGLTDEHLFDGVTLGVDTDIYFPSPMKDPYQLLWASDPGRGLHAALELGVRLFSLDKRFRLHVCYPDYVNVVSPVNHPAIVWHGNMNNGAELWRLFSETGVLPYTSNFMEPSSRAHRQAQAAGSLVLYPPGRGSPSELIQMTQTGVVEPVDQWAQTIVNLVSYGKWKDIGQKARDYAISENWAVQAHRFNGLCERLLGEKR